MVCSSAARCSNQGFWACSLWTVLPEHSFLWRKFLHPASTLHLTSTSCPRVDSRSYLQPLPKCAANKTSWSWKALSQTLAPTRQSRLSNPEWSHSLRTPSVQGCRTCHWFMSEALTRSLKIRSIRWGFLAGAYCTALKWSGNLILCIHCIHLLSSHLSNNTISFSFLSLAEIPPLLISSHVTFEGVDGKGTAETSWWVQN